MQYENYRPKTDAQKLDWLRLLRTPGIGQVTFWDLLSEFGSAGRAIEVLPDISSRVRRGRPVCSEDAAVAELQRATNCGLRLLAVGEPDYPPLLAKTDYPPPLLYVKGDPSLWAHPPIAIVGSRAASAVGLHFTAQLVCDLSDAGFRVVSGLARGIDGAAHRAALPWGTAAVLAGGLDGIYPAEHVGLADEIIKNGVLIGESPPGYVARAQDFPRRNRIIAGSSLGVIVVEATERSGSLITARLAVEANREVFAVPGHPLDLRAAGPNALIKSGATLITSAAEVIDALATAVAPFRGQAQGRALPPLTDDTSAACQSLPRFEPYASESDAELALDDDRHSDPAATSPRSTRDYDQLAPAIEHLLTTTPIDVDTLARLAGLTARELNSAILILDLEGRLERHSPRVISLKPAKSNRR